ncbi:S9 family peptidase [Paenarthrobacter sp. CM16]|uniref:prolyl oligopeptidase family serine peptidase n=1 Tax=Paenarthrobacter sp. CM16 TaxID=2738447 RepID=UPI001553AE21|nr:prolyl oligopeptidase family serine peptidase [Paenarthrobacter sp. CM16]NQD88232.1 S9 family peptidase [Paenarthrobacter sp. CM16]
MTDMDTTIPGKEMRPYFRALLERWDATPRQGLPQLAGGQAAFLWRGPDDAFASLFLASEEELRDAWGIHQRRSTAAEPPGSRIPMPPGTVVRGFTLAPDGGRVAALLSTRHSELAEVYVLAPGEAPLNVPGAAVWYAATQWHADGSGLWILNGKPPQQSLTHYGLDSGLAEDVPFPDDLGPLSGCRLSLTRADGALHLKAKRPGSDTRMWELTSGAWHPSAVPTAPAARLAVMEDEDGTSLALDGFPVHRLSPAEHLQSFNVHDRGDSTLLWLQTASPERPSCVLCLEIPSRTSPRHPSDSLPASIIHRKVKARAGDGVDIPLVVSVRAEDLGPDGNPLRPLPLILTCYGGFGVKHKTEAEPSVPAWLESGGVYVAAQLRGGGEQGGTWHEAGRASKKMRTVQDLIDVASYLVGEGWSSPEQIVAFGASHGGMVVTAAALCSPASFGAVVAVAPLLDTVNLHRHGLGRQWAHEFGTDGETTDEQRADYSPLHLLRRMKTSAAGLPPMLCCLLGRDERVDNSAAVEFVAGIRRRGGRAWLFNENDGGHGQRASADVLAFSSAVLAFAASVSAATLQ